MIVISGRRHVAGVGRGYDRSRVGTGPVRLPCPAHRRGATPDSRRLVDRGKIGEQAS
jgi:hypothetical protein